MSCQYIISTIVLIMVAPILTVAEVTELPPTTLGIRRTVSAGVKSVAVYSDQNEIEDEIEDGEGLKKTVSLDKAIEPLPAEDVKCLMSSDRFCSMQMIATKTLLVSAVKDNCRQCSKEGKEKVGKVIAALLAHDPYAWKIFITKYDELKKYQRRHGLI